MKNVQPEAAQPLIDADFAGVSTDTFYQRYYPQPQPNAQLLGFMAQYQHDRWLLHYQGQAGVERVFNDMLSGKDGEVMVMRDAKNNSVKNRTN